MSPTDIENLVASFVRDRKCMLWVCQRHDLVPGAEPHDYEVSANEALLRYRQSPSEFDLSVAALFWEGFWLEGARSPLLKAIRDQAKTSDGTSNRHVVVLASAADAGARVPPEEFVPVVVFPGLIEDGAAPDSRYGELKKRVRQRVAWDLASRLQAYSRRVLLIIGARVRSDLEFVYEVLEDLATNDLTIVLVWPPELELPPTPVAPGIPFVVWQIADADLVQALSRLGAAPARDVPSYAIRVGGGRIALPAKDLRRVSERFAIITERDLIKPTAFTTADLEEFLRGTATAWAGFAAGLAAPRTYRTDEGLTLAEEVVRSAKQVARQQDGALTFTLQLPADGGSGGTTMLRSAAFFAASQGFPTLVLRPEQVDVDFEDLLAFTTSLSEACLASGFEAPPTVLVIDVEQEDIPGVAQIAQGLAVHGRPAVVVQCVRNNATEPSSEKRFKRIARLRPLLGETSPQEVEQCWNTFQKLVQSWGLPISVPSLEHWQSYNTKSRFYSPAGSTESLSLFWVALRFFLTEGSEFTDRQNIEDALGAWLEKRTRNITDTGMHPFLSYIAALSSFRLISPLSTVLRPITGGTFTAKTIEALRALGDLIAWGDVIGSFDDQAVRFHHPALAHEFLRRQGMRSPAERAATIVPVLRGLSAGRVTDIWLAEAVATTVLTPKHDERRNAEWDWRLRMFEDIPPLLANQSKAILHHWARCLYQSVDRDVTPAVPIEQRVFRTEQAIARLRAAADIPRRPGRDEHPSHLYNTLGTAYTRLANLLTEKGQNEAATAVWKAAWKSFEQSITSSPALNIEALLAFAWRLLEHVRQTTGQAEKRPRTAEIARALSLLDEAEDVLADAAISNPDWEEGVVRYKSQALSYLSAEAGLGYIRDLQSQEDPELGYYCEARLALWNRGGDEDVDAALNVLERAEGAGVRLRSRSLVLRLMLLRRHPTRHFDFAVQKRTYEELESYPVYRFRPIDQFRYAVLCYQVGAYHVGAERFRRLREEIRRAEGAPPRMRDVWRSPARPESPRATSVRVHRITTEWRAEGYVDELGQTVPLRPRHFSPPPKENEVVSCVIRFEVNGPLAVPPRFEEENRASRLGRRRVPA